MIDRIGNADVETARGELLDYLRCQLMGPAGGLDEVVTSPPHLDYVTGVLHPQRSNADAMGEIGEIDLPSGRASEEDREGEDPVRLASERNPASVGFTFFVVDTDELEIEVWGATYERVRRDPGNVRRGDDAWKRVQIATQEAPEVLRASPVHLEGSGYAVLCGRGTVKTRWRRLGRGWFVTASLINVQRVPEASDGRAESEDCLFQVGIAASPTGSGKIVQYPDVRYYSDADEDDLRLLYRDRHVFAVGHGCAAAWDDDPSDGTRRVWSEYIPAHVVPAVTGPVGGTPPVLRLSRLSDPAEAKDVVIGELHAFVDGYASWIDAQKAETHNGGGHRSAHVRTVNKLEVALSRMREGVVLLGANRMAYDAFVSANEAMLIQMRRIAAIRSRRGRSRLEAFPTAASGGGEAWRPFQLAFFLLTLKSLLDEGDPSRDDIDLLWFPTGGGKTEAYLLIAAFEIIYRRRCFGAKGEGTAVITRYTLRLLSTQQFQRSATLIAALEMMRRAGKVMGDAPITIGLWVGANSTPNTFLVARERFSEIRSQRKPQNPFALDTCPWCGTEIIPSTLEHNDSAYGVRANPGSFSFFCPHEACPFHDGLPVGVIDEHLFAEAPTFLLATVDKLARLAWVGRARVFFGGPDALPPSLVIQDELHLLTGPLGTTFGIYECAIQKLIELRGRRPKIIASTATIRGAESQANGLFGRSVRQFPPSGTNASDSYFSRVDRSLPGRMYVGVLSPTHTPKATQRDVMAVLTQAPVALNFSGNALNAYFTQVVYHNTLRELGGSIHLVNDDVRAKLVGRFDSEARLIDEDQVAELTSHKTGEQLADILSALDRIPTTIDDTSAVGIVCTTNMISVGVDIGRLGLMVVVGQPKSTAEYIQATSRVGRQAELPGMVVALYSNTKPRDRSHYESFHSYHQALYRYVEPGSVTPFSIPSRSRALHAALVILVRHGLEGMADNQAAHRFDGKSKEVRDLIEYIADYAERTDQHDQGATRHQLESLARDWDMLIRDATKQGKHVQYEGRGKQDVALLRPFESDHRGLWATANSMRSVDAACPVAVLGGAVDG